MLRRIFSAPARSASVIPDSILTSTERTAALGNLESCVTTIIVIPSAHSSSSRSRIPSRMPSSRLPVGRRRAA